MKSGFLLRWLLPLLLLIAVQAMAQQPVKYKLERDALGTYRVYMSSTTAYSGTNARIATAQVTLLVPVGSFTNINSTITNYTASPWTVNTRTTFTNPATSQPSDYLFFAPGSTFLLPSIPANQDILLFSFSDNGVCPATPISLWDVNSPLQASNSTLSPGNQMAVQGYTLFTGSRNANAWGGNYGGATACSVPDMTVGIGPVPALTVGQQATLPVSVSNIGTATALGPLSFSTTLPTSTSAPASFTSGNWGCSTVGQVVSCSNPSPLSAGGTSSLGIPITPLASSAGTSLTFVGTVGSASPIDGNSTNNVATAVSNPVQLPAPGTPVLVTSVGPVPPLTAGQTASLPVSVSNVGTATANGPITFTTNLPPTITGPPSFTTANGWSCATMTQTVSCTNTSPLSASTSTSFNIPITPVASSTGTSPTFSGTVVSSGPNAATAVAPPVTAGPIGTPSLCAGTDCSTNVRYGLKLGADGVTYTVYMKSQQGFTGAAAQIGTAQVTVLLPIGTQITSATSLQANTLWSATTPVAGPIENSTKDYRSFGLSQSLPFPIVANAEIPLFSFQRVGACTGELALWNTGDPFSYPNSKGTTPGNQITIAGYGNINAWQCNYTCPVACPAAILTLVKQAPASVSQNVPFNYTMTVGNIGSAPTSGLLTVTDLLPAGLTYVSGNGNGWSCSAIGQAVTCTSSNAIAPNGSSSFSLTVKPITVGTISNSATVSGGGSASSVASSPCVGCPVGPTQTIVSAVPSDLAVTIQLPQLLAGQANTLTVTLTNLLAGTASGPQTVSVVVHNGLSVPATFSTATGWTCSTTGQTVVCTNPVSLSSGQSLTLPISVTPASSLINNYVIVSAQAAFASNESITANNFAYTPATLVIGSDLALTFGAIATLVPGQSTFIPINITNNGQATAPGTLTLNVTLPTGVSLNAGSLPVGWSLLSSTAGSGGTTIVTLINTNTAGLSPGGLLTLNLPVTVGTGVSGSVTFVGTVVPVPSESNTVNNTASTTTSGGAPDLIITVTGPNPAFVVGQSSNILLTITNMGTLAATGPFTTTLTVPAGYTVNTAGLPAGWSVVSSGTSANGTILVLQNNAGSLAPGQSLTLILPVTPGATNANQTATIQAIVNGAPGELVLINNNGSLLATPTASGLTCTVILPSSFTAGIGSSVTIIFTNNGTAPYSGSLTTQITLPTTVVIGTLPAGWIITSTVVNLNGTTTYTFSNASVNLFINSTINLVFQVTPAINTAGQTLTVTVVTVINPWVPSAGSTTNIQIALIVAPAAPTVTVVILPIVPTPSVGQQVSLSIVLTNTGTGAVNGPISTTISLPAGFILNPGQLPSGWIISSSTAGPGGTTIYVLVNSNVFIAAGSTLYLNLSVTVGQAAAGTSPSITIFVLPAGQTTVVTATLNLTLIGAPSIVLVVGQPAPTLAVGQTSILTLTVTNVGTATAYGVLQAQVTLPAGVALNVSQLTLPTGWSLVSSTAGAGGTTILVFQSNNTAGFTVGSSVIINLPIVPSVLVASTTISINVVIAPVAGQTSSASQVIYVLVTALTQPDLIISAAQPVPTLTVGQSSSINVTITNIGSASAAGPVSFQIAIPAGMTVNTAALPAGWIVGSVVAGTGGSSIYTFINSSLSLGIGMSTSLAIVVTPGASLASATMSLGLFVNAVVGETNLANNSFTLIISTPVQPAPVPDLAVSFPAQSFTLATGQTSLLSFNVANIGTAAAGGPLSLTLTMPVGFSASQSSFVTGGWGCVVTGNQVVCTNATGLGINTSSALTIPVLPGGSASGMVNPTFQVSVAQATGETVLVNNFGTINYIGVVISPDLAVSFPTQSFTLTAGQPSNVLVQVSNVSALANAAGPLSFTFAMPAGFSTSQTSFATGGWQCTTTGSLVGCTYSGGLAAGSSLTLTVPVVPPAGVANPSFVAVVAGVVGELNLANNTAQLFYNGPVLASGVKLALKALLQGPFNDATGLMNDDLRQQNLLPLNQPYATLTNSYATWTFINSGTETTTSSVLSVTGPNAIVDWVMVELRSAVGPATVVATKPALIQRDGDVVSASDGVSPLTFTGINAGSYYVVIRHRNHLGAMSKTAITLSATTTAVDLTNAANVYVKPFANVATAPVYSSTNVVTNLPNPAMLWAGDTDGNGQVIFQGGGNDLVPLFSRVVNDPGNTSSLSNYIATSYDLSDVNLDGKSIFQGPGNEVNTIFFNVLNHPDNSSKFSNFVILQHLP